jgi:hypothetical protein
VLAEVLAGTRTVGVGDNGSHVLALEEALVALGYDLHWRTQPNESLTPTTRNAIARFQRDQGIPATGTLDAASLAALDLAAQQALGAQAPVGPRPTDHVPAHVLSRYGLSTTDMQTRSSYEGTSWGSVGYFPYFGEVQYAAFAKHAAVFGEGATVDSHGFFERFADPPTGLAPGSWIGAPVIEERDFERTAGVNVSGARPVDGAAYKLLRTSGAPADAVVALRDAGGAQLPVQPGDRLVPTVMRDGAPVEVDLDGEGRYRLRGTGNAVRAVTWRLKRQGGVLYDPGHRAEDRSALLGLTGDVPFDFLDEAGRVVPFRPGLDRVVEAWRSGNTWNALAGRPDGSYVHQTFTGDTVQSTRLVTAAEARDLRRDQSVIRRVQRGDTGALMGDGQASSRYDMSWWGKCHNVAALSATDMPLPRQPVRVITDLAAGETPALEWRSPAGRNHHVLVPRTDAQGAITGYEHQTRASDGTLRDRVDRTAEEAARLASDNGATAVIARADGTLRPADVTAFDTETLTALVSHIGDGAAPRVRTAAGRTHHIGERRSDRYVERDRSELRAPGLTHRTLAGAGGERMAYSLVDMTALNDHRADDITELIVLGTDGTEQTLRAQDVSLVGWENRYDLRPSALWELHGRVSTDRSSVVETAAGEQVWNFAVRDVRTEVIDPATLSHSEKIAGARPGMMAGTVERDGKTWFETKLTHDGGEETYRYWVRFDPQGEIEDYGYHGGEVPDFVWTQLVKTDEAWVGMSQAPGVRNRDIQRLYRASQGRLEAHMMPGGYITERDLKDAAPTP